MHTYVKTIRTILEKTLSPFCYYLSKATNQTLFSQQRIRHYDFNRLSVACGL